VRVRVNKIPVRYNGKTYRKGETFDMAEKYFNESLVSKVKESKKQDKEE
jgi:hypothetical protein